jgi:glycosyltransferase involved in cell wall biosynthesis
MRLSNIKKIKYFLKIDAPNYFPENFLNKINSIQEHSSSKNYPKISIIMPSYNQGIFIEKSILSILNQDYPNLELIIIDGGSIDNTIEIIKKYEDRIAYWASNKDNGQSDALNIGFSHAKGEIFGWLNSDDLYMPETFKLVVEAYDKNKELEIIYGDWLSIDENDKVIDLNHAFDFNVDHFKYESFHINAQSMFWKKKVHDNFSGFNLDLIYTMDYQMILEFGLFVNKKSYKRVNYPLGAFRRHKKQKTQGFTVKMLNEHIQISKRYNFEDKYRISGKVKRFFFRVRRFIWYLKRGGIKNLLYRLYQAYVRKN